MGYTKLFQKILASSIWNEDVYTKVVWITMLAMKDQNQIVSGSIGGLAHLARIPIEECRKALAKLEGPDPDDSSGVRDGRRIEPLERGGWFVINGKPYRDAKDEDERREYMAAYMRAYRARKQNVNNGKQVLAPVSLSEQNRTETEQQNREREVASAPVTLSLVSESVPKPKQKFEKQPKNWDEFLAFCEKNEVRRNDAEYLYNRWNASGWTINKQPIQSWKHAVRSWKTAGYLPSQKPK